MTRAPQLTTEAGRAILDLLHELAPGGRYSARVVAIERESATKAGTLGAALLYFRRHSHTPDRLEHDHHCSQGWGGARCTCGWAQLEAELLRAEVPQ